jgi:hypothetical protein
MMYSPKIKEEYVVELYRLKLKRGRAMTKLVNEAIREYLEKQKKQEEESNGREELS